jgi:hypothetical protein
MIKSLKKYQVQSIPFDATKEWSLNNTENSNLLLAEDGTPYALEFLDYGDGSSYPVDNDSCDIALEQQDANLASVEEGLKVTGIFYPDSDPKNVDGTYKRSIYAQVKTLFYNTYFDPSKIWGIENIDFELSETSRHLSDAFNLIDIPRIVFGDKIIPNTFVAHIDAYDNPYIVTDDGNGNLFAGTNLFSYQQELGEYRNQFIANISNSLCDWYWQLGLEMESDTASVSIAFYTGSCESQLRIDTSSVSIGFAYGSAQNVPPYFDSVTSSISLYSGSMQNVVTILPITGSLADIPILMLTFNTGFTTNTVTVITSSFDSASVYFAFNTGSILLTTFPQTASFDSASVYFAFNTGSRVLTTFPQTMSFNQITTSVAFYQGSLM